MQGLSEQAVNAFRVMRGDGLKASLLALNSLINAFGEDRRDAEAFAVLQYMKDNVSEYVKICVFSMPLDECVCLHIVPAKLHTCYPLTAARETGCCYLHHTHESVDSCGEI